MSTSFGRVLAYQQAFPLQHPVSDRFIGIRQTEESVMMSSSEETWTHHWRFGNNVTATVEDLSNLCGGIYYISWIIILIIITNELRLFFFNVAADINKFLKY